MAELEADCLKTGRSPMAEKASQSGICRQDGGDAMQIKRKKLSQGVSMKSLKGAHFEVELQEKLQ